jgi:hypothetical protein
MTTNSQDENENAGRKEDTEKRHLKRAYKKPSFRYEAVLVTSALACGKVHATQELCMMNRKAS